RPAAARRLRRRSRLGMGAVRDGVRRARRGARLGQRGRRRPADARLRRRDAAEPACAGLRRAGSLALVLAARRAPHRRRADHRLRRRRSRPHRPDRAPAPGGRRLRAVGPMTARIVCFHCGEAVDRPGTWRTAIDGVEREMCCVGCRAVAEAIAAAGLTDYYRTRSAPAAAGVLPEGLEALRIWDDDDVQARFVRAGDDDREASLLVDGLRCGACVWLLEQTLRRQPGVVAASVNLATERATIRWNPATTQLSRLLEAIGRIGYAARPSDARGREQQI